MKIDTAVGGLLFTIVAARLLQKGIVSILVWFVVATAVASQGLRAPLTISVAIGIIAIYGLSVLTQRTFEGFEDEVPVEEKTDDNPKTPSPAPPKTSDPHVDIGTTILHAYRNLSPEQIGGMRKDTRELLELQKELMGSLSEMKPAIEQGAELLKTFSTFFGDSAAQ
jgi:molecular chaperone DnaK (HSP70)